MNKKPVKKWLFRIVLGSLLIGVVTLFWANKELRYMYGASTPVVDHSMFEEGQQAIVIQGVNVLSPDAVEMLAGRTVVIDQGQIVSIGVGTEITENAFLVDGEGKYLIPGLIDSHVHLLESENDLLLYLVNGVTHVREMTGSPKHLKLRGELENGRIGPSLYVASPKLVSYGFFEGWFHALTRANVNLQEPEDANALVQSLKEQGYDAIKLGTMLDAKNYTAVNMAGVDVGIPIIGHLPLNMSLSELQTSQQVELSHIEEIVKPLVREFGGLRNRIDEFLKFVEDRSEQIAKELLDKNIAVTSTLSLVESIAEQKFNLISVLEQAPIAYVNPGVLEGSPISDLGWFPGDNRYQLPADTSPDDLAIIKESWQAYAVAHQILLKAMALKGVKIIAGTDTNIPVVVPGFSLHSELKSLTKAGLSPTQALLSATSVPAGFMNSKAGIVQPGYPADLVLLSKNPLLDIENTKSIDAVISKGHYFDRSQLDAMLQAVKEANEASRKVDIDQYMAR